MDSRQLKMTDVRLQ